VEYGEEHLRLEVEDRGVGMPANGGAGLGIGMVGMMERAELVHGKLEVARPEAGGTLIRLEIPLVEAAASG
jgi:signal transduction histidine kinase